MSLTLHLGRREWSASWGMAVLTLCAVVLFVNLGRWQWHRAQYKQALEDNFSRGNAQASPLGSRSTTQLPRYAHVETRGRYDGAHQFLLDNITHGDQAGYDVLTPLQMDGGRTLLVDRGWVPLINRRQLPDVALSAATGAGASAGAEVQVRGRLDDLPVVGIALGRVPPAAAAPWPRVTAFPDMAQLARSLGRPLEARQLLLDADQPDGFVRQWQPVTEGFGPAQHISYAFQWWGLAALAAVLFGTMNLRKLPPPP